MKTHILLLTAALMAAFGIVVAVASVAARFKGTSARPLVIRYLSWFLMIPPVLLPLLYSRQLFQAVILLLSLQCIREFGRATGLWQDRAAMRQCYLLTLCVYLPLFAGWYRLYQLGPLVAMAILLVTPIFRGRYEHMLQKVSLSILGVLYFGWFLSHLAYLRDFEYGVPAAFWLLTLVACGDAFGYLWGKWLGRHKLTPRISPNKTVEGALCAILCVMLVGFLLRGFLPDMSVALVMLLAMLVAVLGICGDLVISFIKRDVGVKDMGVAIPGHGGILDRCDSLILTAPAYFHLVRCFHGY
jgi:phosphatidate cytidylyltransferase